MADITTTWGVDYTQGTAGLSRARQEFIKQITAMDRESAAISKRIAGNFAEIGRGVLGIGSGAAVYAQLTKAVDAYTNSLGRAADTSVNVQRKTRGITEAFGRNISQGYSSLVSSVTGGGSGADIVDAMYNMPASAMRRTPGWMRMISPAAWLALESFGGQNFNGVGGESYRETMTSWQDQEAQARRYATDQRAIGYAGRGRALSAIEQGDVAGAARLRLGSEFSRQRSTIAESLADNVPEMDRQLERLDAEHKAQSAELEHQLSLRQRALDLDRMRYGMEERSAEAMRLRTGYRERDAMLLESELRLQKELVSIDARSDITQEQKDQLGTAAVRSNRITTSATTAEMDRRFRLVDRGITNDLTDSRTAADIRLKQLNNRWGQAELDTVKAEYARRRRDAEQDEELKARNPALWQQRITEITKEGRQVGLATAIDLQRRARIELRNVEGSLDTRTLFGAQPGLGGGQFGTGATNGQPDEGLIRTIEGLKQALQDATAAIKSGGVGVVGP